MTELENANGRNPGFENRCKALADFRPGLRGLSTF